MQAEARLVESAQRLRAGQAACRQPATWPRRPTTSASRAARTAEAQLVAARDGLKVAEAEKAQIEAQRRELTWRRGRTEVMAPADGIVSRRMARVGGYAAGAAEPMFRIVANGEVELDAEVIETRLGRRQGRPGRARRGRGPRRDRRQGAARLARGRQGDPARPRAHLPGRQPGACASARFARGSHRDGQPATASPCRPPPCSTGPTAPSCRWCATEVETRPDQDGTGGGCAGRGARGLGRGRPRRVARPAPSCATATPCGPSWPSAKVSEAHK